MAIPACMIVPGLAPASASNRGDVLPVVMHVAALAGGSGTVDTAATSAMIEKEKHKLEVLKRRQERDIQQVSSRFT